MLMNVLDNYLDINGNVVVNGFLQVRASRSSTDPVTLYADPKYQNEFAVGRVTLDIAGRLQGADGALFFKEDSVWVDVHGDENGVSTRLFSFEVYRMGGIGQTAGGSVQDMASILEDEIPSSRIVYHAHKLKYLIWNENAVGQPNGITTWRPTALSSGLYTWETTILDMWDVGIDNSGTIGRVQAIVQISNIAKFVVKAGRYYLSDSEFASVDFADLNVEVEAGAAFVFANGGGATWIIRKQPTINSMLRKITWSPTSPFSFRASMLWNDGNGEGLIHSTKIDRLFLDADFHLNNVSVNETIGSLNYLGNLPTLTGNSPSHSAGKLTGVMSCKCIFDEGALSQIADGNTDIRCSKLFVVDKPWELKSATNIYFASVIVNPNCKISAMNANTELKVGCIIEASSGVLGDNLDIVTHRPFKILKGDAFNHNYPKTATNYIKNIASMMLYGEGKPTFENFVLHHNNNSMIDNAIYVNCFFSLAGSPSGMVSFDGNKKITMINCRSDDYAGFRIYPLAEVPTDATKRKKRVTFKGCDFGGGLLIQDTYGAAYCELIIEDSAFRSITFDLSVGGVMNLSESLKIGAIRIKNFTDKSTGCVHSTDGAVVLSDPTTVSLANKQGIIYAYPSINPDKNRPFPLNGWGKGIVVAGSARAQSYYTVAFSFVAPRLLTPGSIGQLYATLYVHEWNDFRNLAITWNSLPLEVEI